ncbi:MAG: hypothetical protein ACYC6M_10960 [Terriglobales bacterium]
MLHPSHRLSRTLGALIVVALLLSFGGLTVVRANTFAATTTAELIADIATANGNGLDNTITLTAGGTYAISSANNGAAGDENGLPVISSSGHTLTINGNGATLANSAASARFFTVNSGATLVLNNLTLSNGKIVGPDSAHTALGVGADAFGGAINNQGTVTASVVTFSGNSVVGGDGVLTPGCNPPPLHSCDRPPGGGYGGAINNTGTLTLTTSIFTNNSANGGNATQPGTSAGQAFRAKDGGNAFGGAIYTTGSLTVSGSTFTSNGATGGGGAAKGVGGQGGNGGRALGGAIALVSATVNTITTSTFSANHIAGGGGLDGGYGGSVAGGAIAFAPTN